jgi:hypothetical protein
MDQTIINWLLGGLGTLLGFLLKSIWQAVKDLQNADKTLSDKVASIEVLVAGNYVRRDDFDRVATAIFTKLDRIEDKLGSKVDK